MAYNVLIQPSGHRFRVEPGESVLEADLREAGGVMPYGCRNGACGACMGKVLAGEVAYPQGLPHGLSAREQQEGKALFCQAQPLSDLVIEIREVQTARDIAVRTLPCRVMALHRLAPDVMRLYLKLPAAERLQFLAGQYIDILLRDGRRRGFSLANPPHADEHLELHVRQVPGGEFTTQVFTQMREKAILRFQGPLGTFFLREDSPRPILMIGGGTGFAPLKSMLEHAFHVGITRPIHLYWGARTRQDLYLNELPEAWAEKHLHFTYTPVLSEPRAEDGWTGRSGLVHAAAAADYPDLSRHDVYMAGPPAMIQAARQTFSLQGLSEEHLYFDSFDYAQ
ncbi:MAG: CDP-6-deoxy-delta-3,4-glucoseen reductase [Pseudomonadota bacterium]|nr:CDP-6-deoxy-delta-3,4-glucoseen reductase [Pseudomonadota bacterium]